MRNRLIVLGLLIRLGGGHGERGFGHRRLKRESRPGGDGFTPRRVGCEHAEIAVAMFAWRWDQRGDAIQKLSKRKPQNGLPLRPRPGQAIT